MKWAVLRLSTVFGERKIILTMIGENGLEGALSVCGETTYGEREKMVTEIEVLRMR